MYLGDTDGGESTRRCAAWRQLREPADRDLLVQRAVQLDVVPALQRIGWTGVELVSFGDFPMAGSLTPPVTVIDQDPGEVGRFAAERLFLRIDQPDRRLRRKTVLPVRLVDRSPAALTH